MIRTIFCALVLCVFSITAQADEINVKLPGTYSATSIIKAFRKAQEVDYAEMYLTIKTNHNFEPGSVKKVIASYEITITGRSFWSFVARPEYYIEVKLQRYANLRVRNWRSDSTSDPAFIELEADFKKMLGIVYKELQKTE